MKMMEYTIKVTTAAPMDPLILSDAINAISGVKTADVVAWRTVPNPAEKKA